MANIEISHARTAVLKLVAYQALQEVLSQMVAGSLVHRDFEPNIATLGDTVNIPIVARTYGGDPARLESAQVCLNRYAEANFLVPDISVALQQQEVLIKHLRPAARAIAEQIDTAIIGLQPHFPETGRASGIEAAVDAAEVALFVCKAPHPKYLIVDPPSYARIRKISGFREFPSPSAAGLGMPGSKRWPKGPVGVIGDFHAYRSNLVRRSKEELRDDLPRTDPRHSEFPQPVVTRGLAFASQAIALVTRHQPDIPAINGVAWYAISKDDFTLRVVTASERISTGCHFTVEVLYGVGVMRKSFGIQVNSTDPTEYACAPPRLPTEFSDLVAFSGGIVLPTGGTR